MKNQKSVLDSRGVFVRAGSQFAGDLEVVEIAPSVLE